METRKLTESAMLSALFAAAGIFFISSAIAYSLFLDIGVPIFIILVYLRCDFKYTLMSAFVSLILMIFTFGNIAIGIWMIQSIIVGLICGFLIKRNTCLCDDLFYSSISAGIVLIFVDVFFSGILGYSFITEAYGYLKYIPYDGAIKEVIFYIMIAAMPLGTILISYIGGLFLAEKLKLLDEGGRRKFLFVRKYKKFANLQYCSKKTTYIGIIYILFLKVLGEDNIFFNFTYLKTVLITAQYIAFYFLIKDSYVLISNFIYKILKSKIIAASAQALMLFSLLYYFTITSWGLILTALIIDKKFSIRKNIDIVLRRINFKYNE